MPPHISGWPPTCTVTAKPSASGALDISSMGSPVCRMRRGRGLAYKYNTTLCRLDNDVPFRQCFRMLPELCQFFQDFLTNTDTFFIHLLNEMNHRGRAYPLHIGGPLYRRIHRREDGTIPVVFQSSPASLNRIIFTMVWRIILTCCRKIVTAS